jgi:hypothetical protein
MPGPIHRHRLLDPVSGCPLRQGTTRSLMRRCTNPAYVWALRRAVTSERGSSTRLMTSWMCPGNRNFAAFSDQSSGPSSLVVASSHHNCRRRSKHTTHASGLRRWPAALEWPIPSYLGSRLPRQETFGQAIPFCERQQTKGAFGPRQRHPWPGIRREDRPSLLVEEEFCVAGLSRFSEDGTTYSELCSQ